MAHFFSALMLAAGLAQADPHTVDADTAAAEIMEVDRAFARYARDHGVAEAFAEFIDPDEGRPLAQAGFSGIGAEAAREAYGGLDGRVLAWAPEEAQASGQGDFGVSWGFWTMAEADAPETFLATGKYMTVWRRDETGRWRFLYDIGSVEDLPDGAAVLTRD